jgi:hypothetical protein
MVNHRGSAFLHIFKKPTEIGRRSKMPRSLKPIIEAWNKEIASFTWEEIPAETDRSPKGLLAEETSF